jgi:hypothetical protein
MLVKIITSAGLAAATCELARSWPGFLGVLMLRQSSACGILLPLR